MPAIYPLKAVIPVAAALLLAACGAPPAPAERAPAPIEERTDAEREARLLGHREVGDDHLLLGVASVEPGLIGVAMGTAVPLLLISGVATAWYACHVLAQPFWHYLWEGLFQPGLVSLAFLAPALLAAWTTRMVCVSHFERQLARQLPLDPERVSVVHNALADVPWLSQPGTEPASLVMVARMAAPKRPDLLLQALHQLAGQGLAPATHLLGGGPTLAVQQQHAQDLKLPHVHFAGDVPNVAEQLAQHQIFVLLSDHEGLPISVLEAMRSGLAIVASRLPGVEELITDGEHGLLVPNEPSNPRNRRITIIVLRDSYFRDPKETQTMRGLITVPDAKLKKQEEAKPDAAAEHPDDDKPIGE